MSTNSVVLQSETAGKLTLQRSQVAAIHFDNARLAPATSTMPEKLQSAPARAFKGPGSQTNLVEMVQRDLLSQATPEATKQFQDMVSGLLTGRLTVDDLKKQAKSISDQAHAMKADMGDEAGMALDSYLAILDNFLKDKPVTEQSKPDLAR